MDPALWEIVQEGDNDDEVEVLVRLRRPDQAPNGLRIVSQFGDIVTGRSARRDILSLRAEENVASVKAPRLVTPDLEFPEPAFTEITTTDADERRPPDLQETGKGVVIGVCDWGLDFAHPNFRHDDGRTRLLALWDQRGEPRPMDENPYGYGLIHSVEAINRALEEDDPYAALDYYPADSDVTGTGAHGTHVMDIAAGNGHHGPSGIAPEAKLVFVHMTTRGKGGLANLGNSVTILEAVDFVAKLAAADPWVINLSMGQHGGPHDGLSLVEQGLDQALLARPDCAIINSTGNYRDRRVHTAGRLRPGETRTISFTVDAADITPNELEIWYPGVDAFVIELRSPDQSIVKRVSLGQQTPLVIEGQVVGKIYHRARDPNNFDNHFDAFLYPGCPIGKWEVTLIGEDVVDGRYHAWIERDATCYKCQVKFEPEDAIETYTTGTICNGRRTIAVGAYDAHSPQEDLSSFSSCGPTRDGRQKPDLVAPGDSVLAARSSPREADGETPWLTRKSGTSMAAPHVTGAMALIMEATPKPLPIIDLRRILLSHTRRKPESPEVAVRVGSGYLDIQEAVAGARTYPAGEYGSSGDVAEVFRSEDMVDTQLEPILDTEENIEVVPEEEKTRNLVLISGGPGPFNDKDVEHDQSWANYVTPPLLMKKIAQKNEEVWWFIYKPAYERRWQEDSKDAKREGAVQSVKDQGFDSYLALLEDRAKSRGWHLRWLDKADDFWDLIKSFSDPISRVIYWGHARHDLWLSLRHNADDDPIAPKAEAILTVRSIDHNSGLKKNFAPGDAGNWHRFVGCNTIKFAEAWSKTFGVWSEGVDDKVNFKSIHATGGEPCLASAASIKVYNDKGKVDTAVSSNSVIPTCKDAFSEEQNEGLPTLDDESLENVFIELAENDESDFQDWDIVFGDESWPESDDEEDLLDEADDFMRTGWDVLERVDEAITNGDISYSASDILRQIATQGSMADEVGLPEAAVLPSPAQIFDGFTNLSPTSRIGLDSFFEVIAFPGEQLTQELQEGDILVRRAYNEGQLSHLALLADNDFIPLENLAAHGLRPESYRPGLYAQVIESGAFPHRAADRFARRVVDYNGRLDADQMIIRMLPQAVHYEDEEEVVAAWPEPIIQEEDPAEARVFPAVEPFTPAQTFIQTDLKFETHTGLTAPFGLSSTTVSTAADLRARLSRFTFQLIGGTLFAVRLEELPFATPFYREAGGNIEVALESRIFYPADPQDRSKLARNRRRFPVALIVHGNANAITSAPTIVPDGGSTTLGGTTIPTATLTGPVSTLDSYLGFEYLQQELARHGIVSMSVNHNGANLLDLLLTTRAEWVLAYLDQLRGFAADSNSRFYRKLDFNRVALIGHSRGGDAVIKALQLNAARQNRYGIKAVTALSPTDVTGALTTAAQLKVGIGSNAHFLVMYGSHDGDVSGFCGANSEFGTGFRHYDRSSAHRAMVFVHEATHNGFNTNWTIETPGFLDAAAHQTLAREYIGGWQRYILNGEWSQQRLFNGLVQNSIGQTVSLQWKFGRDLKTIDNFDDADDTRSTIGGNVSKPAYIREIILSSEAADHFPHPDRVIKAEAPSGSQAPLRFVIPAGEKNFSNFDRLIFRVTKKYPLTSQPAITGTSLPDFEITLEDTGGNRKTMPSARVRSENPRATRPIRRTMTAEACTPPHLPVSKNITKNNLETWHVPLSFFSNRQGVNLAEVRAVEFKLNAVAGEPIYLDSVSLVKL